MLAGHLALVLAAAFAGAPARRCKEREEHDGEARLGGIHGIHDADSTSSVRATEAEIAEHQDDAGQENGGEVAVVVDSLLEVLLECREHQNGEIARGDELVAHAAFRRAA